MDLISEGFVDSVCPRLWVSFFPAIKEVLSIPATVFSYLEPFLVLIVHSPIFGACGSGTKTAVMRKNRHRKENPVFRFKFAERASSVIGRLMVLLRRNLLILHKQKA